jgi:hypothetical protein
MCMTFVELPSHDVKQRFTISACRKFRFMKVEIRQ